MTPALSQPLQAALLDLWGDLETTEGPLLWKEPV